MTRTGPPDERDAWLQAALRHAPDADATPPAAVRDAILRAARAAPRAPSLRERIDAAWGWLARPPVAAAFASLLLGSAIVVLWREPPPEAVDPIARATPAEPRSPAPAAPPAPPSPAAPTPPAKAPAAPAAPLAQPAAADRAVLLAKTAPPAPPAAAAARGEAPPVAAMKDAVGGSAGLADASAVARSDVATDVRTMAATEAARARRAESAPARAAALPALAPIADPPALWAAIATQPDAWTWQRADGSNPAVPSANLQATAAELAARTAWSAGAAVESLPTDVLLRREGRVLARLQFGEASLGLALTGGQAWQSRVDAETLARLRRAFGG